MRYSVWALLFLVTVLTGCGKETVDASGENRLRTLISDPNLITLRGKLSTPIQQAKDSGCVQLSFAIDGTPLLANTCINNLSINVQGKVQDLKVGDTLEVIYNPTCFKPKPSGGCAIMQPNYLRSLTLISRAVPLPPVNPPLIHQLVTGPLDQRIIHDKSDGCVFLSVKIQGLYYYGTTCANNLQIDIQGRKVDSLMPGEVVTIDHVPCAGATTGQLPVREGLGPYGFGFMKACLGEGHGIYRMSLGNR